MKWLVCLMFLVAKFFSHLIRPHFPTNSLIMQLLPSIVPCSSQKWPYLFLTEETSHGLRDTVLLKPWIHIRASFLPLGLVSNSLGTCISPQHFGFLQNLPSFVSCILSPCGYPFCTHLLISFVSNTSGVLGKAFTYFRLSASDISYSLDKSRWH